MQTMRPGGRRQARGQSIVELAMILPVALFLLLGAVDYAQVLSAEQRLENAAHVATLRLLTQPGLSSPARLMPFLQAESGLAPVNAGATYSVSGEGADQVAPAVEHGCGVGTGVAFLYRVHVSARPDGTVVPVGGRTVIVPDVSVTVGGEVTAMPAAETVM